MTATDELRDMLDAHGIEVTLHRPMTKTELARENAKLRELVRDLWEYIYIGTANDGQALHDRTRELGVEVDG